MSTVLRIFVPGIPRPAGSKRGFVVRRRDGSHGVAMSDSSGDNGKAWRSSIVGVLASEWTGAPLDNTLALRCRFVLPRPASHFGSRRGERYLKPTAPAFHASKPDTTKLLRAVEDACNGVLWVDDSRIAKQYAEKVYGDRPGVEIEVALAMEHAP